MAEHKRTGDPAGTTGQRIRYYRDQAGMSRRVFGGLIGKSPEWVKAVENCRLLPPRLPMLTQIAAVLGVRDVTALLEDHGGVPVVVFAGTRHAALADVQAALTDYRVTTDDARPADPAHLALRLSDAWRVRHCSPDHRTRLGALLPDLIRDAQRLVRTLRGAEQRDASCPGCTSSPTSTSPTSLRPNWCGWSPTAH